MNPSKVTPSNPLGAGRPRAEVDLGRLTYLLSLDCSLQECAAAMGCSIDSIQRRVESEGWDFAAWSAGKRELGRARIRERLDTLAEGAPVGDAKLALPALTANIWLSKQRLGYSDRSERGAAPTVNIQIVCPDARTQQLVEGLIGPLKVLPAPDKSVISESSVITDRVTEDSGSTPIPSKVPPSQEAADAADRTG